MKSTKAIHWKPMRTCTVILSHGAQLQIVDICFSMMHKIMVDFLVFNARNNIVLTVDVNGIRTWHVNNTKYQQHFLIKIKNSLILLKVLNINNVLNVKYGLRKIKDVIIWHVNVNLNSVINVVVFIWSVNVWKNKGKWMRREWEIYKGWGHRGRWKIKKKEKKIKKKRD